MKYFELWLYRWISAIFFVISFGLITLNLTLRDIDTGEERKVGML